MDKFNNNLSNLIPIDSGGQSRILLARMNSKELKKEIQVIVKEIEHQNEESLLKELRCLKLSHDNIIKVYGYENSPNRIIFEYCELGNLENFIERDYKRLKVNIIEKIKGLIIGIDYIHQNKILHMDLHPKNILITDTTEAILTFKICDFGLSEEEATDIRHRSPIGRPGYVSPEKVRSEDITKSSDIWALGCILWKIFSTKEAFDDEHSYAIYYKIGRDLHPSVPLNWPIQVQKLLFHCWDIRCTTSMLLEIFGVSRRNKQTGNLLQKDMPLTYEKRYIKIDEKRIVPPIIWDSLDKNDKFSQYQFPPKELEKLKKTYEKYLCLRKFKKIENSVDLLKYLNECGYFINLKELNEKLFNSMEMRTKLLEAITMGKWVQIARSLGMPDKDIDEIKNQTHEEILNEIFEFWSIEMKQYHCTVSGLLQIFQSIHLDVE